MPEAPLAPDAPRGTRSRPHGRGGRLGRSRLQGGGLLRRGIRGPGSAGTRGPARDRPGARRPHPAQGAGELEPVERRAADRRRLHAAGHERLVQVHAQRPGDVVAGVHPRADHEPQHDPVGRDRLDAPQLRLLGDVRRPLRIRQHLRRRGEHPLLHRVDVDVLRHGHVDDRPRPALRQVADAGELAVAHVPEHAVRVADLRDADADGLHDAARQVGVHDVADAELVVGDHEEAGEHVLHDVLRPEAEAGAQRGGDQGERRRDLRVDDRDDVEDRHDRDHRGHDVVQHRAEGARPRHDPGRRDGRREQRLGVLRALPPLDPGDDPLDEDAGRGGAR